MGHIYKKYRYTSLRWMNYRGDIYKTVDLITEIHLCTYVHDNLFSLNEHTKDPRGNLVHRSDQFVHITRVVPTGLTRSQYLWYPLSYMVD